MTADVIAPDARFGACFRRRIGRACRPFVPLSEQIASDDFAQRARHSQFPNAFIRAGNWPLPALITALLSMLAPAGRWRAFGPHQD
jgi:hypothetical protein